MGQYYMPTLIDHEGNIKTLYSHDYDNGLKLMEHSYIGNGFVNAVSTIIWKNPMKVAWLGDYSDNPYHPEEAYSSKMPHEDFMKIWNAVWRDEENTLVICPVSQKIITMRHKARYIVNHTRKCYIRIGDYISENRWMEENYWNNAVFYPMCIHPLPLLTACGNDRGGGDYHSSTGYEHIGTWAFDLIEITDKMPKNYESVMYHFRE